VKPYDPQFPERTVKCNSKIIGQNICFVVDSDEIPSPGRPESNVLSAHELLRLLDEAQNPSSRSKSRDYLTSLAAFYPAIAFLAYTGARRGEALALQCADLASGTETIRRSLSDTEAGLAFKLPKSGKPRSLSIAPELVGDTSGASNRPSRRTFCDGHCLSGGRPRFCSAGRFADPPLEFRCRFSRSRSTSGSSEDSFARSSRHPCFASRQGGTTARCDLKASRSFHDWGHGGAVHHGRYRARRGSV
jgi:integrase